MSTVIGSTGRHDAISVERFHNMVRIRVGHYGIGTCRYAWFTGDEAERLGRTLIAEAKGAVAQQHRTSRKRWRTARAVT